MDQSLHTLRTKLFDLQNALKKIPYQDGPVNNATVLAAAISMKDVGDAIFSATDIISNNETDVISDSLEGKIKIWNNGITAMISNIGNFHNANAAHIIPSFYITIDVIRRNLESELVKDDSKQTSQRIADARKRVSAIESRIDNLQERSKSIDDMVSRIEDASSAADQLPTDLDELAKARKYIKKLQDESLQDAGRIVDFKKAAELDKVELNTSSISAKKVLDEIHKTYTAATSFGLGKAFDDRSKKLNESMWIWVGGLVASLIVGGYVGSIHLQSLTNLLANSSAEPSIVLLNVLMSILSIGAPVWFAWIATKQIGQRFRLAEDYAFKASISKAYEGYRSEASRINPDLENQLLKSALTRLDELPLRLVEAETHGSPWHELASSEVVKKAISTVPGFLEQVKDLANKSLDSVAPVSKKVKENEKEGSANDA